MKIKGILFDKDGTLFDFRRTWGGWFEQLISELSEGDAALEQKLARSCGYDLAGQQFTAGSIIVIATADEVNQALADCLPTKTVVDVDAAALRHLENLPNYPVCDLRPLLQTLLDSGLALGLATNDYEEGAELQLTEAKIRDQFAFVCGYDSGHGAKPGAGMVHAFCAKTGLQPDQIAVVGDSIHDLEAGEIGGVALRIAVLTGPATKAELHPHADVVLTDISELPEFLA